MNLHAKLVDFKKARPLTGAAAVPIAGILGNARFVAYGDCPFLDALHAKMGVGANPDTKDYVKARDALFQSLPVALAPLDNIVVTQENVNLDRVKEIINDPATGGTKPIFVVRYEGESYIMNGHHRVVADVLLRKGAIT